MKILNDHERRANKFYLQGNYKDALEAYFRSMQIGPAPTMYAYLGINGAINAIRIELEDKGQGEEHVEDLKRQQISALQNGVSAFPEEKQLWSKLAFAHLFSDDAERFFEVANRFIEVAKEITRTEASSVLLSAFFLGDMELCLRGMSKYSKGYVQSPNPLAQIIHTFGDIIIDDFCVEKMLGDWRLGGMNMKMLDNAEKYSWVTLFKGEDIRKLVVDLPNFNSSCLDDIAGVFKIIVHYLNRDMGAVKAILRRDHDWFLKMAEEIAVFEGINNRFDPDFLAWVPDIKPPEEVREILRGITDETLEWYDNFLFQLSRGEYKEASRIVHPQNPVYDMLFEGEHSRKEWEQIYRCIAREEIENAINLIRVCIKKYKDTVDKFCNREYNALFALLYSKKRFSEAKEVVPYLGEGFPLEEEVQEVLAFEEPEERDEEQDRVLAKEYALEAFDELRGYVKEHPADLVQIVESYVRDKHRFSEHNEVARFLHYLVLRGDMYLDEEDGENHLFDLVTKKRAVIREEIPKQNFDRIWRIVTILKRIEVVVTPEFLRQWFKQHLDSDVSTEVLAVAMIQNNWHTDSRISTPYREFLGWSVRERLNISHYSYLFSGENKSSVSQKKKRKVTLKAEQAEEVFEAVSQEKSLESWTFFISRTSNSVESVIAPTPQAFSEYFGNDLINVTGEKVLEKLEYLLSFDEYQRMVFPGIKLVYKGYHKLRIGVVRIFWKIVPTEKEIHFFVVNRRDAY